MTAPVAFVDGALLPRAEATVSIDDAAVRYGAACFETMRATNGRPFRLAAHLERLGDGLAAMGVEPPSTERLAAAVTATLEANDLSEARLRLSVSAGRMPGPDLTAAEAPSIVVIADPVSDTPPPALALAVSAVRIDAGRPIAFAKTAQYLGYLLARAEARATGADDALLLNTAGAVCETSAANLFAVRAGRLVTPSLASGPLPGVTRAVILEILARDGIALEERALTLEELADAEEVFVTNSVVGTQPVRSISLDGAVLWSAADEPGALTIRLGDEYAQLVTSECGDGRSDG